MSSAPWHPGQVINPSKWNDKPTILWMMVLRVDGGSCGVLCSGGVTRSCRSLPALWRRGMTKNNKNFLDNRTRAKHNALCVSVVDKNNRDQQEFRGLPPAIHVVAFYIYVVVCLNKPAQRNFGQPLSLVVRPCCCLCGW